MIQLILFMAARHVYSSILKGRNKRFEKKVLHKITGAIIDQGTNAWRRANEELLTGTDQSIHDIKKRELRWAGDAGSNQHFQQ